MNPETLKAMKEQAVAEVYEQFCGILNECQVPVIVDIVAAHFVAEVERQAGEIERLGEVISHQALVMSKRSRSY
jgi:hypothetical protein